MKNKPEENRWLYRDVKSMSQLLDTDPIFLDADYTSTIPGNQILFFLW